MSEPKGNQELGRERQPRGGLGGGVRDTNSYPQNQADEWACLWIVGDVLADRDVVVP